MAYYAHTLPDVSDRSRWELLFTEESSGGEGHLNRVGSLCAKFARDLSVKYPDLWRECGWLLGMWHDLGKYLEAFQVYLNKEADNKGSGGRVAHARDGAFLAAAKAFSPKVPVGDLMAYAIAGHHAGLQNGVDLFEMCRKNEPESQSRLKECERKAPQSLFDALPFEEHWRYHALEASRLRAQGEYARAASVPGFPALPPDSNDSTAQGFAVALQVRMLFSCLVDADFLATEAFMSPERQLLRPVWPPGALEKMSNVLEGHLKVLESRAEQGEIQRLRAAIHRACFEAGAQGQGVFQLNVPTGGGKTLSSLSFALEHARQHDLQRVIYVIPYQSIIDQTASEFRSVFADLSAAWGCDCVLEHHSAVRSQRTDGDSLDADEETTQRLKLLSENWDVPLVVTTSVQFFESLFANKPSACRKLHNMARSVIIFDEAQTLPTCLLNPCLHAMKALQRDYGCTLVLCTATQPALAKTEAFPPGWEEKDLQSLLGREMEGDLQRRMKRVHVERLGQLDLEELVDHVRSHTDRSCLLIVNLTRQAQDLFSALKASGVPQENLYHMSARMCPEHREFVREAINERLVAGEPVILVATRVVEAGVDLSFPVVYRDRAGLDSVAQAAGRCNRHGENPLGGKVYLFEATDYEIPASLDDLKTAARCTRDVLATGHYGDILAPEAIHAFFELYYSERGRQTQWDKTGSLNTPGILAETICPSASRDMFRGFSFAKVASAFHLIPPGQQRVMVPWGCEGRDVLKQLERRERAGLLPERELYRRIQRLSVAVYENDWRQLQEKRLVEFFADDSVAVVRAYDEVYDADVGFLPLSSYDPTSKIYIS